jgi:hypothetical protein
MLLLFGIKTAIKQLPGRLSTCRYCGSTVEHYLEERASKFTVFFIPLITLSRKYRITCSNCGQQSSLSRGGLRALSR